LPSKCTRESVPSNPGGKSCGLFLRKAHPQSGFNDFLRRMPCDHKPMMRRKRLDAWGSSPGFRAFPLFASPTPLYAWLSRQNGGTGRREFEQHGSVRSCKSGFDSQNGWARIKARHALLVGYLYGITSPPQIV
jgi:hypothetical protein